MEVLYHLLSIGGKHYEDIKKKILVLVILVVGLIVFFRVEITLINHPEYTYYKRKSEVEDAVKTILETGKTDGIHIPGIVRIDYYNYKGKHPTIGFATTSYGLAPSSKVYGFYYSVDSVPVAYLGPLNTLVKNGEYWKWHSYSGYSRGETKHIEGKWYTFKYSN